jgi:hypothetical protein
MRCTVLNAMNSVAETKNFFLELVIMLFTTAQGFRRNLGSRYELCFYDASAYSSYAPNPSMGVSA